MNILQKKARIRIIHKESNGRYVAPKIFALLKQDGYTGSIDRVQRIMKRAGIRSNSTKKYKPASSKIPGRRVKRARTRLYNGNYQSKMGGKLSARNLVAE